MQIICISRYSYGYGKELAEELASALGYDHIAREELTDLAAEQGIPVGKLETAILKQQLIKEEHSIEIERFKALITAEICERAKRGGVVYHGRVGHKVLQGLPNVLRIRAIANEEERIKRVMKQLNITRKLALDYIKQVDEDRCRYSNFFYNVDCNNPSLYDIVINSTNLSIENSIDGLVKLAKSPRFQFNPASEQKVDDLLLQARCRLAIGEDERTRTIKVNVSVNQGNVSITYLPPFEKQAESIPPVLEKISGLKTLVCTMAATTILYIQEQFNPEVETFNHLVEIAGKWNSAVELVRLDHQTIEEETSPAENFTRTENKSMEEDGGILDDIPEPEEEEKDSYGMLKTINKLIQVGRAGAAYTIYGGTKPLTDFIKNSRGYCLVVVGEVFLSSSKAAQKRMKRDLVSLLSDQSRVPVISSDDLKEQYLFGPKQKINTLVYALFSVLLYYLMFTNQDVILNFITSTNTTLKILAAIVIVVFVPIAAYIISGFSHNIMKLVKLE